MDKTYIQEDRYLSLKSGFLLCSLRPFRMLTSAWARLPILGGYGTRDKIASLFKRLSCYQDVADSRKAMYILTKVRIKENTKQNFKNNKKEERGFLPRLKPRVSTSSFL